MVTIPSVCPTCGTQLVKYGANIFCPNEDACPDQVSQRLQHSVSKGCLDWDGCGPAQVQQLIELGCRYLSDFFSIDETSLSVMGPATKAKFLSERERVKKTPLWRKLHALGIESVGMTSCKELASKWHDLDAIGQSGELAVRQVLGPVAAESFFTYARKHVEELGRLEQHGYVFKDEVEPDAQQMSKPLAGKSFCITGSLCSGERSKVQTTIEQYGGTIKSVSKKLNYLVVGVGGGQKEGRAKELGVACITEEELYDLIGIPMPIAAALPSDEL